MMILAWRVYVEPKYERPAEFLGCVKAETCDDALTEAARAWKGKRFLLLSESAWATLDARGRAFYEGRFTPPDEAPYRQISADVRSCACETCGTEIFYRINRNRSWRKPPAYCKACDPSPYRKRINKHSAYVPQ
jgi:hypothetical protein